MRLLTEALLGSMAAFAFGIPPAQGATPAEDVEVRVEPGSVIAAIPEDFIGFGYETSAVAHEGTCSPPEMRSWSNFIAISPPTGSFLHRGHHPRTIPPSSLAEGGGEATLRGTSVINSAALSDLARGFSRATGWKAMWGLNLQTGSKEAAAEEAVAVANALGAACIRWTKSAMRSISFPVFPQGRGFD